MSLNKQQIENMRNNLRETYKKYIGVIEPLDELCDLAIQGLEQYVPYSTDDKGYPHMAIDEKGRGRLLCLAPKNPTDSITQHGV